MSRYWVSSHKKSKEKFYILKTEKRIVFPKSSYRSEFVDCYFEFKRRR